MSLLVVPTTSSAPSYVQNTTLEGSSYVLQFDFNQRACAWYLSIADASGVDIYNGIKLSCGMPLLRKCSDVRRPPGELLVLSSTADTSPPGLLELLPGSGRCSLLYCTSDWIAQLSSSPLPGAVAVAAGSTAITFSQPQTLAAGAPLTFGAQPGAVYYVAQAIANATHAVLTTPYNGATAAATSANPTGGGSALLAQVQANTQTSTTSSYGQQ